MERGFGARVDIANQLGGVEGADRPTKAVQVHRSVRRCRLRLLCSVLQLFCSVVLCVSAAFALSLARLAGARLWCVAVWMVVRRTLVEWALLVMVFFAA